MTVLADSQNVMTYLPEAALSLRRHRQISVSCQRCWCVVAKHIVKIYNSSRQEQGESVFMPITHWQCNLMKSILCVHIMHYIKRMLNRPSGE